MDWSALLSTLLGGALVVGGSFLAQIRSERQALGREDRDRRAAVERDERQREQEREVWGYAGPSGAFKAVDRGLRVQRDLRADEYLQLQLDFALASKLMGTLTR